MAQHMTHSYYLQAVLKTKLDKVLDGTREFELKDLRIGKYKGTKLISLLGDFRFHMHRNFKIEKGYGSPYDKKEFIFLTDLEAALRPHFPVEFRTALMEFIDFVVLEMEREEMERKFFEAHK